MRKIYLVFLIYYLFLYFYSINFLSFSIVELQSVEKFKLLELLFEKFNITNDYSLRIIPVIFSFFSVLFFFNLSEIFLKKDKYIATVIFLFIPGFIVSSVLINKAVFLIFFTLLFIYTFKKIRFLSYLLLICYVFVDYSFIALYFSLIFYAIYKKDTRFLFFILFLMAINANYFDYKIGGKPKGFLVEVLAIYILIFSPFVFFYFVYTIYKGFFFKKDIVFFIGSFTFLISIFLSFRQKIKIDDFAPFVLPYTLYMYKIFISSYRVRLRKFRLPYKLLFVFLFSTMIIFDVLIFLGVFKKGLDKSIYFVKPLSKILKEKNINQIYCNNVNLCRVLNFYGIKLGNEYYLKYSKNNLKVSILYNKKKILDIDVSNLNTLKK